MKKILLIILFASTYIFAQWDGTTNKTIHERDLFGAIFDQALDSSNGGLGSASQAWVKQLVGDSLSANHWHWVSLGYVTTQLALKVNITMLNTGTGTGAGNTAGGLNALDNNTSGYYNTAFGNSALTNNTTGISNTAVGYQALTSNTTGSQNTAVGLWALTSNTTGIYNTGIGQISLEKNTSGSFNTALGQNSLDKNTTGDSNVGLGHATLLNSQTNSGNTAVGTTTLSYLTSENYNTAIGFEAARLTIGGQQLTNLSNSTFLGAYTRSSGNGNTNEIVIGYNTIGNGTNTVTFGNTSIIRTYLRGLVTADSDTLATRSYVRGWSGGGEGGAGIWGFITGNIYDQADFTSYIDSIIEANDYDFLFAVDTASLANRIEVLEDNTLYKSIFVDSINSYYYSGTDTISSYSYSTTITHGATSTPLIQNIYVTPQTTTFGYPYWISDVTATTFKINIGLVGLETRSADILFSWQIRRQ